MADVDAQLLSVLAISPLADTWEWASTNGLDHQSVVGAAKSLEAEGYVTSKQLTTEFWTLTPEAQGYVASGSPEAQLFAALTDLDGLDDAGLEAAFPGRKEIVAIGKGKAMQKKWIVKDKASGKYKRNVSGHSNVPALETMPHFGCSQLKSRLATCNWFPLILQVPSIDRDELVEQLQGAQAGALTDEKVLKDLAKRQLLEKVLVGRHVSLP